MLGAAATEIGLRLPAHRPLWRLTVLTGLQGDRSALIVAFHHVLADGMGGLAVLANLVAEPLLQFLLPPTASPCRGSTPALLRDVSSGTRSAHGKP